jgi:hypothetical protein
MFRRGGVALATILAAAWISFPQTPDDLRTNLASGQPRDIAWAAYSVARQGRQDLIPNLAALIASYQAVPPKDHNSVPPEVAAIEAVADALIQLEARLPAATIMHLYPQFPAQTMILLSRSPDSTAAVLEIFQTTHSGYLWLAAGNLRAVHPPVPPGFARSLLSGFVAKFVFWVVPLSDKTEHSDARPVCYSDFVMPPIKPSPIGVLPAQERVRRAILQSDVEHALSSARSKPILRAIAIPDSCTAMSASPDTTRQTAGARRLGQHSVECTDTRDSVPLHHPKGSVRDHREPKNLGHAPPVS